MLFYPTLRRTYPHGYPHVAPAGNRRSVLTSQPLGRCSPGAFPVRRRSAPDRPCSRQRAREGAAARVNSTFPPRPATPIPGEGADGPCSPAPARRGSGCSRNPRALRTHPAASRSASGRQCREPCHWPRNAYSPARCRSKARSLPKHCPQAAHWQRPPVNFGRLMPHPPAQTAPPPAGRRPPPRQQAESP